jgi:hypothetical protein
MSSNQPNISEHQIPEVSLNLNVEKKNIESYFYFTNPDQIPYVPSQKNKEIEIKNYNLIDSEYIKSYMKEVEEKVLHKSESSSETKPVNYEYELKQILRNKEEANKYINTNIDEAIMKYRQILIDIDDITKFLSSPSSASAFTSNSEVVMKILEQKKLIMSNLSLGYTKRQMFKESIDLDLYILSDDKKFDKAYGRLINSYTMLDDLDKANFYYDLMKKSFGNEVLSKYTSIFSNLENKNLRADEGLKLLSKKSIVQEKNRKEESAVSQIGDDDEKTSKTSSIGYRILNVFFGSTLLVGSSLLLGYLFKNKNKFL